MIFMDAKRDSQDLLVGSGNEHPEVEKRYNIILGRGNANSWRPGNTLLHKLLDQKMDLYHSTTQTAIKMGIVEAIYDNVKTWGRFLDKNRRTNQLVEISKPDAIKRISQAMRYRRRRLQKLGQESSSRLERPESVSLRESETQTQQSVRDDQETQVTIFSDEDLVSVLGSTPSNDWPMSAPGSWNAPV